MLELSILQSCEPSAIELAHVLPDVLRDVIEGRKRVYLDRGLVLEITRQHVGGHPLQMGGRFVGAIRVMVSELLADARPAGASHPCAVGRPRNPPPGQLTVLRAAFVVPITEPSAVQIHAVPRCRPVLVCAGKGVSHDGSQTRPIGRPAAYTGLGHYANRSEGCAGYASQAACSAC